jgi:hypothetical protein
LRIVDQVCEKIRPHLTPSFQSGRLGVSDFRELLKRVDFSPKEKKYVGANFRFVITKLGLFHYLPEIQGNEDIAVFQLLEVIVEKMITSGTVKNRKEAINGLFEQFKKVTQSGTSTFMNVSEAADTRITLQSLREIITKFWEESPEKIPDLINRFRDEISETSGSSRLLYDISKFGRELRGNKIKYLEDIISEIDSWEQRLHL